MRPFSLALLSYYESIIMVHLLLRDRPHKPPVDCFFAAILERFDEKLQQPLCLLIIIACSQQTTDVSCEEFLTFQAFTANEQGHQ